MISDNDLLLYHYDDGLSAAERALIGAALAKQPELAARLKNLVAELDVASAAPEVLLPAASLHRWQTSLDRAARVEKSAKSAAPGFRWRTGLAALAVLLFVTTFGLNLLSTFESLPEAGMEQNGPDDTARYERGLQMHLAQTELQLASLNTLDREDRVRVIDKVMVQNRLYAIAADRANEGRLARMLRAFDPLLEDLAVGTNTADLEGGVAQLNFELKVMQAGLATLSSASPNPARSPLAL